MKTRAKTQRGFTVVELMISLVVGGIAISSIYAVGAASTRHFREQARISTTQSSLRSAMNQLKRDFSRAGYLGTPNASVNGEWCGSAPNVPINEPGNALGKGRLAAISALHKNVSKPTELDPDNLNPNVAVVDDVILMGNYATSGEYMGVTVSPNNMTFTVPTTSQSFTRDFTNWYAANGRTAGACSDVALQAAFPKGRLLRVRNLNDTNGFGVVSAAACSTSGALTADITVQAPINGCNPTGGWIAPISAIHYYTENAKLAGEMSRTSAQNRVVQLRRTEVDPSDKTKPLTVTDAAGTRNADDRVVLDYVVRFTVDFLVHPQGQPRNVVLTPATEKTVQDNPEFARTAIIELAARTAEHEPDMDVTGNTSRFAPFRLLKNVRGAARTRALRAEVFMPNIAFEDY